VKWRPLLLLVLLKNETIWFTQKIMAELAVLGVFAITKILNKIFERRVLAE
jgi:hypothetical protein